MRTGLSPHPTNISDTARDRTVIPDGGADKADPRRLPCTVCRASAWATWQAEPTGLPGTRVGPGGWRPGQRSIPRAKQGEESARNELWSPTGGSPPPAPHIVPAVSRTVISRYEHACTHTHPTPGEGAATGSRQNTLGARSG